MIRNFFLSAFIFIFSTLILQSNNKNKLTWQKFDDGLLEAEKSERKILVAVYTDWCGWCKRMDKDVYEDSNVISYLNKKFIVVKLNAESANKVSYKGKKYTEIKLAREFGVNGYPTTLFLKPNGELITSAGGYIGSGRFLEILQYIGDDYYAKMSWKEYQEKKFEEIQSR